MTTEETQEGREPLPDGFVEQQNEAPDEGFDELPDDPVSVSVARATMVGDLTNLVLELIKRAEKPWSMMTEYEQNSVIGRAQIAVSEAVTNAVNTIATDDRPTIGRRSTPRSPT